MMDKELAIKRLEYLLEILKNEKTNVSDMYYSWKREEGEKEFGYLNFSGKCEITISLDISNPDWKKSIQIEK
jgi:hypothetical protein